MESSVKRWYDNTWLVILLLIVFFPVGLFALWKNTKAHIVIKVIVTVFFGIVIIAAISDDKKKSITDSNEENVSNSNSDSITSEKKDSVVDKSFWNYSSEHNEMDNNTTYYAQLEALDVLSFSFPYEGGTRVWLNIRHRNRENDVMITISQGQFMTRYDDNYVRIKFDEGKPVTYSFSEPSDNSTTTIFINNANSLIKKIKLAEFTYVECEFYQEGRHTLRFCTRGLKWNH